MNYTIRTVNGFWARVFVESDEVVLSYEPRVIRDGMIARVIGDIGQVLDEHELMYSTPDGRSIEVSRVKSNKALWLSAWIAAHLSCRYTTIEDARFSMSTGNYAPIPGKFYRSGGVSGVYERGYSDGDVVDKLVVGLLSVILDDDEVSSLWPVSTILDPTSNNG